MMLTLIRLLSGSAEAAARRAARHAAQRALAYGLAAFLVLVGIFFLIHAAWFALALAYSPLAASLAVGFGAVVLGLIAVAIGRQIGRRHASARRARTTERRVEHDLADIAATLRSVNPTLPLLGALALGFFLTRRR